MSIKDKLRFQNNNESLGAFRPRSSTMPYSSSPTTLDRFVCMKRNLKHRLSNDMFVANSEPRRMSRPSLVKELAPEDGRFRNRSSTTPTSMLNDRRQRKDDEPNNNSPRSRAEQRFLQLPESADYVRVRSFSVNSKGDLVNQGYSYRHKDDLSPRTSFARDTPSPKTPGSPSTVSSLSPSSVEGDFGVQRFNVLLTGDDDVGKTSLVNLLKNCNAQEDDDALFARSEADESVSVRIAGKECELVFNECNGTEASLNNLASSNFAAMLVMYSVTNKDSFSTAADILYFMEKNFKEDVPVFLVGNKVDLERQRAIQTQEGKELAKSYKCKFAEISVELSHQTDDLLKRLLILLKKIDPARRSSFGAAFLHKKSKCAKSRANSLYHRVNANMFDCFGRMSHSCSDIVQK